MLLYIDLQKANMAWGDERCIFCDNIIHSNGTTECQCHGRLTYHKAPEAPVSAMRMYYDAKCGHDSWQAAIDAYNRLPVRERQSWEAKASADRARFVREKTEYNHHLPLDEEILTDKEEEDQMECGNAVSETRMSLQRRRCEQQWARYRRDHWKFNNPALGTAASKDVRLPEFHRFQDLPPEIRSQVYCHLFDARTSTKMLRQWQLQYESADIDAALHFTHLQPLDTRILAVSRNVYAEALEVLYSSRCFTVNITRASVPPLFVREPTGSVSPRPTSRIKRWHIQLTFTDILHKDLIFPQLRLIHDAMKDCISVEEVRFSWISVPDYWTEVPYLRREYDGMLSMFKDVQGVKKVLFTESVDEEQAKYQRSCFDGWNNLHLASEGVRREVKSSMESPK